MDEDELTGGLEIFFASMIPGGFEDRQLIFGFLIAGFVYVRGGAAHG